MIFYEFQKYFLFSCCSSIAKKQFTAAYKGEKLMCGSGTAQVKTSLSFKCDESAFWNNTNDLYHGGAKVHPNNLWNSTFDNATCQVTI